MDSDWMLSVPLNQKQYKKIVICLDIKKFIWLLWLLDYGSGDIKETYVYMPWIIRCTVTCTSYSERYDTFSIA